LVSDVSAGEKDDARDIEKLLSAPHGFSWASGPEIQKTLARVKAAPERYLPIVKQELSTPSKSDLKRSDFQSRYEQAILLLEAIGNDQAREILHETYFQTRQLLSDEEKISMDQNRATRVFLSRLQGQILKTAGTLTDKKFVDDCLVRLEKENPMTKSAMLSYLGKVGRGDGEIKSFLERKIGDDSSSLYQDKQVRQVLVEIDK